MTWLPTPAAVVNAASGALLCALGAYVLTVRPRRQPSVAFAAFSILFGLAFFFRNLVPGDQLAASLYVLTMAFWTLSAGALVLFAWAFPRPPEPGERRAFVGALGAYALYVAASLAFDPGAASRAFAWFDAFAIAAYTGAFWFALLVFATRFRAAGADEAERRRTALVSAGLLLFPAGATGAGVGYGEVFFGFGRPAWLGALALVLVVAFWVRNTSLVARPASRWARDVVLVAVAVALGGLALAVVGADVRALGTNGILRTATFLVLAYAILRHQLLGLDMTIKWTLKQSTVAAVFVAVFFAVSEAAQAAFSDTLGTAFGIAAAAALVFAIHPLQHVAQRVADKAMPGVKPVGEMTKDERLDLYREQLRIAWSDGNLSADERRLLVGTRAKLRISAEDAARVEEEVAP